MQQITEETTRVMTDVEVALHKRKQRLDGLLQHGDPFTGRFLCDLRTVACFAKDLVEHNGKVTISTATKEGIHGSRILSYGPDWKEDLSLVKPITELLKERLEKYRIGFSLWEHTYSFENLKEMLAVVLEVLLNCPNSRIENKSPGAILQLESQG